MAVQRNPGPIVVDADDLQTTHRGRRLAVKFRAFDGILVLLGCLQQPDGSWQASAIVDTGQPPEALIMEHGSAAAYIATQLGRINAWLGQTFPAGDAPPPALAQMDAALAALRWAPQPDGTLKVQVAP